MASGVTVSPAVKEAFEELKIQKRQSKYLLLALTDKMDEVILKKDGRLGECDFNTFTEDLKEAEELRQCRFAIYDYEFDNPQGGKNKKLVYMYWAPENAKVKEKMVYSATSNKLQSELGNGIAVVVEAHDMEEASAASIEEKLVKK